MTNARLERLRRYAYWLDAGIGVPGTPIRFGLDPILGLIPGLGDAAGAVLAGWILVEAARMGASRATLTRIGGNIALDALLGAVPVVGDVFDVVWKADLQNVVLLERHLADPAKAKRADGRFLLLLLGGLVLLVGGLLVGGAILVGWLIHHVPA